MAGSEAEEADVGFKEALPPNPYTQFALRLIPKIGGQLAQLRIDIYEQQLARAGESLSVAMKQANTSDPEEFLHLLRSDPVLLSLLNLTLDAAMRSRVRNKRIAFGRAIGDAAVRPDFVDEKEMIVQALDGLEVAHIRLLLQLARIRDRHPIIDLATVLFRTNTVCTPLVARLQQCGAILPGPSGESDGPGVGVYGGLGTLGGVWRPSDFGLILLMHLDLARCGVVDDDAAARIEVDGGERYLSDNDEIDSYERWRREKGEV